MCLKMVSLYLDTVRPMIMTYNMLLLHCLHPYLLPLSFCHFSCYVIINLIIISNDTKIQYILPSLIAVSKFMTDEVIQFDENSTSD